MLYEGFILDKVNCNISIIQDRFGLKYGTDAYLLSAFLPNSSKSTVCEAGCGSGIISLLLLKGGKAHSAFCVDVQNHLCEIAKENAAVNGVQERMTVTCQDVLTYRPERECDSFVCNPPYMKDNSGKVSEHTEKYIARHETSADIYDFAKCAYRSLKDGGNCYFVYRPDRCADIIYAMKSARIEPKIITFVYATVDHESCLMLIKGKKGASSGMMVTKPLIIYKNEAGGEYTDDMKYIYDNQSFPKGFFR